ncbi:hypothetical protein CROQUDRAFT_98346 [Cronartium quercuum f. sp. fusiforme G11]|uniref:Uncharacterized protein n=1 Tax=Cronartium quercuum f. sp. fusiforme G11 TaxID=708437 RepID=A0A9P6NCL4_9BASI|nr:hypothetical protein CROQUDRAFT_98346 [Cronartium quercuum f. sp. fusiforme G11]
MPFDSDQVVEMSALLAGHCSQLRVLCYGTIRAQVAIRNGGRLSTVFHPHELNATTHLHTRRLSQSRGRLGTLGGRCSPPGRGEEPAQVFDDFFEVVSVDVDPPILLLTLIQFSTDGSPRMKPHLSPHFDWFGFATVFGHLHGMPVPVAWTLREKRDDNRSKGTAFLINYIPPCQLKRLPGTPLRSLDFDSILFSDPAHGIPLALDYTIKGSLYRKLPGL